MLSRTMVAGVTVVALALPTAGASVAYAGSNGPATLVTADEQSPTPSEDSPQSTVDEEQASDDGTSADPSQQPAATPGAEPSTESGAADVDGDEASPSPGDADDASPLETPGAPTDEDSTGNGEGQGLAPETAETTPSPAESGPSADVETGASLDGDAPIADATVLDAVAAARSAVVAKAASPVGALQVNIDPDLGSRNWTVEVQRKVRGAWTKYRTTTTAGAAEIARLMAPTGVYRVKVPAQYGQTRFYSPALSHRGIKPGAKLFAASDGRLVVDYPNLTKGRTWYFLLQRKSGSSWVTTNRGYTAGSNSLRAFIKPSGTYRLVTPSEQHGRNNGVHSPLAFAFTPTVELSSPKATPGELRFNANPNLPGNSYWRLRVEQLVNNTWKTYRYVSTQGTSEVVRFRAPFGVYRAYLVKGYAGGGGTYTAAFRHRKTNDWPTPARDYANAQSGRSVTVNVLANDRDPNGDKVSLVRVVSTYPKAVAAVRRVSSTSLQITPRAGFVGTAYVRYEVRDQWGATARGAVQLTVTRPPVSQYQVERKLAKLGLPVGAVDGGYDDATRRAMCAWREVTGRNVVRTYPTTSEKYAVMATRSLPRARSYMVSGMNINKTCQTGAWVSSSRTYRMIVPVTTGLPKYETRSGVHRVFWNYPGTWQESTLYPGAMMYRPMYFSGGQAMHGSSTDYLVGTRPLSHGCVRMYHRHIDRLRNASDFGTGSLVYVYGRFRG